MVEEAKGKDFWEKPEGKTGMIFAVAILAGAAILFINYLPTLLMLAQNTLYLILMLMGIGVLGYIALDSSFRNLLAFMYKVAMKKLTGMFIEMDPIAIIEVYIDEIKNNRAKMDEQLGALKGQIKSLDRVINENIANMDNQLGVAKQAQKVGQTNQVNLKVRMAEKLKESNMKLSDLKTKLELLYKMLSKMYENTGFLLEDITFEVEVQKRERKAITTGYSAMRSAMKIINGDKDKKMMFDEAMEFMAEDIGMKVGEMERFMDVSANFMNTIDLQNGVIEEKGLQMLEQWEKDSDSLFLIKDKSLMLDAAITPVYNVNTITTSNGERQGQYAKLFDFNK
jgi:hypothetical protein